MIYNRIWQHVIVRRPLFLKTFVQSYYIYLSVNKFELLCTMNAYAFVKESSLRKSVSLGEIRRSDVKVSSII